MKTRTDYPDVFLTVYKTSLFPLYELTCTTRDKWFTPAFLEYMFLSRIFGSVVKKKEVLVSLEKKLQNPNTTASMKSSHVARLQCITYYIMINRVFTKWKIKISKKKEKENCIVILRISFSILSYRVLKFIFWSFYSHSRHWKRKYCH